MWIGVSALSLKATPARLQHYERASSRQLVAIVLWAMLMAGLDS